MSKPIFQRTKPHLTNEQPGTIREAVLDMKG